MVDLVEGGLAAAAVLGVAIYGVANSDKLAQKLGKAVGVFKSARAISENEYKKTVQSLR